MTGKPSIPDHCWTEHDGQSRILDPAAVLKEFTRIHNEAIEQAAKVADDESHNADWADDHSLEAQWADNRARSIAAAIRSLKLPDDEK